MFKSEFTNTIELPFSDGWIISWLQIVKKIWTRKVFEQFEDREILKPIAESEHEFSPGRLTESRQWFGRLDEKWLGDRERNNCIGSLEPRRNYCRGIYPGGTDRCYQFIRGSQPTAKPLNDVLMGPVKGWRGREKRETRLRLLPRSVTLFGISFFFSPPRWRRMHIRRILTWIKAFVIEWDY